MACCRCCEKTGACCNAGSCTQETCADCADAGGEFQGVDTECAAGSCPCDPPASPASCEKCVDGSPERYCSETDCCVDARCSPCPPPVCPETTCAEADCCVDGYCVTCPPPTCPADPCTGDTCCVDGQCIACPEPTCPTEPCAAGLCCVDGYCVPCPAYDCAPECGEGECCVDGVCQPCEECTPGSCPSGQCCVDGVCTGCPTPCSPGDCGEGYCCVDGYCLPCPPPPADPCAPGSCGPGLCCVDGYCLPCPPQECPDTPCPSGECCIDGYCTNPCAEGEYCCNGACQGEPCATSGCCCVYEYDDVAGWSVVSSTDTTSENCIAGAGQYALFQAGVSCADVPDPCVVNPEGTCCTEVGGCLPNGPGTGSGCYPTGSPNDDGCFCDDACYLFCFDCCGTDAVDCCAATPDIQSLWDDSAGPGSQKMSLSRLVEDLLQYSADQDELLHAAMQSGAVIGGHYKTYGYARVSLVLCCQEIEAGVSPWVAQQSHRQRVVTAATAVREAQQ